MLVKQAIGASIVEPKQLGGRAGELVSLTRAVIVKGMNNWAVDFRAPIVEWSGMWDG